MAILFGRIRSISRGNGDNAIQAASYRSCSKLQYSAPDHQKVAEKFSRANENIEIETESKKITFNYSKKEGLLFSQIFAPSNAPEWVFDREKLWQRIEDIESRVNSELAKEYIVALPRELSKEENIELLKEFIETTFVSRGMVADVNYHGDNPNNPHAHIMFPMRQLEVFDNGEVDFGEKERDWKSSFLLAEIKQEQSVILNKYYEKNGYSFDLQHGKPAGLMANIHHSGMSEMFKRNLEIIKINGSRIIANPELVINKLDHKKAVFTKEEILLEIEKALWQNVEKLGKQAGETDKANVSDEVLIADKIKIAATSKLDMLLMSPKITLVNANDMHGRMLFARTSRVELEKRFCLSCSELSSRNNHAIEISDGKIKGFGRGRKKEFLPLQKEVIKDVLKGSDLSIIEGLPGSGKSTVTQEIIRHYHSHGYKTIALAPTNKAAIELSNKLGFKVYTAHALRMKWQLERLLTFNLGLSCDYYKKADYAEHQDNKDIPVIDDKTILILDEMSMIDAPSFDYFISEVKRSGAKAICLGDNNQHQAIGISGASAKAIEIAGSHKLYEVNRHQNPNIEHRNLHNLATKSLGFYRVMEAINIQIWVNYIFCQVKQQRNKK